MGRVKAAARNIIFGYIGNLTTQLLGFVLRTIFIRHLGQTLNGVNALYFVGIVHGRAGNWYSTELQLV